MQYQYTCEVCYETEKGFDDEFQAEHAAQEHMTWDHGYKIEAYYSNGDYAYQCIT